MKTSCFGTKIGNHHIRTVKNNETLAGSKSNLSPPETGRGSNKKQAIILCIVQKSLNKQAPTKIIG